MTLEDLVQAALDEADVLEHSWEAKSIEDVQGLPTPWPELNEQLPIGGIPRGYITEITGESYAGKTVLAWELAKNIPSSCVVIADTDKAIDPKYMKAVGINPSEVILLRGSSLRQMPRLIELCVKRGAEAIILDTLSATLEAGKLTLNDFHAICGAIHGSQAALIVVNQKRNDRSWQLRPMYYHYTEIVSPLCFEIINRGFHRGLGKIVGHRITIKSIRNRINHEELKVNGILKYGKGIRIG